MQILSLLDMYFDVVVKVKTFLILFRLAPAILCLEQGWSWITESFDERNVDAQVTYLYNCKFLNERT